MKTLLVVLVVLGVGGYFGYRAWAKPEKRACARMVELCGASTVGDADKCERETAEWIKVTGSDQSAQLTSCMADAKSCPQAMGCYAGTGMKALGNALGDFLKGVGDAMKK